MDNQTNRLAQLIATAADKELGTRVITDGQPRRQDKAAALAIEAEYMFVSRAALPKAEIVDRDGVPHVDVGSDAGTWSCKTASAEYARRTGLEYLAAAEAINQWHQGRKARRDEIRVELIGPGDATIPALEKAIDRIIELERKAA